MEGKLEEIAQNTRSKDSFLVTLTGIGSKIDKYFEPEIAVKKGCHYEIAFASLETSYSMPNVNKTNNTLQVSWQGFKLDVVIEVGCYGLMQLNDEIQRLLKGAQMTEAVSFEANYSTFKCIMSLQPGCKVTFGESSLGSILGFDPGEYSTKRKRTRIESNHKVQILAMNSILVHCNLVGGSYLNGKTARIVHSFFPKDSEPGDKIVERPVEYIYLPIASDVIHHMSVWLTDQDERLLDLREETLTIKFHLKAC